jgi:folylpolyglutamate synthase/dihydropteroate synthase
MTALEKEKLNEAINELLEAMDQYENLNDHWIRNCLEDKEYDLLMAALMPLAYMQRVNEKLQKLWVN